MTRKDSKIPLPGAPMLLGLDKGTVRRTLLEIQSGDASSLCPKDGA
jgi:hypothetical protein